MTREHHRDEAEQRIRASDWQWQEGPERSGVEPTRAVVLGSVREAIVALTEAVLALSATERVETGGERMQRRETVVRLDEIDASDDPEKAHAEADEALLEHVHPSVREAYERVVKRAAWWAAA